METKLGKAIFLRYMEICEHRFKRYKNPLAAWEAIKSCDEANEPYPDWVHGYLLDTARRVLQIGEMRKAKTITPQRLLMDALGLDNLSKYCEHARFEIMAKVFWAVNEERARREGRNYGRDKNSVNEEVAKTLLKDLKLRISPELVDDYYQEIQGTMKELTTDLTV